MKLFHKIPLFLFDGFPKGSRVLLYQNFSIAYTWKTICEVQVLEHYSNEGFVDVSPITLPGWQPNLPFLQVIHRVYIESRQSQMFGVLKYFGTYKEKFKI